ncbi:MAG TPA: bacteriocin [Mollicutes bacterium]|nr:bacteriocin [Mollicutes bacterium]
MILIDDKELNNIYGGGFGLWIAIGSLVTFLIGVIDGYVRPLKCNK